MIIKNAIWTKKKVDSVEKYIEKSHQWSITLLLIAIFSVFQLTVTHSIFPFLYGVFLIIGIVAIIIINTCGSSKAQLKSIRKNMNKRSCSLAFLLFFVIIATITEALSNPLDYNMVLTMSLAVFLILQFFSTEKNLDDFFIKWQYNVIIISQFFIYRFFYYFITLITSQYKNVVFIISFITCFAVVKFSMLMIRKIHKHAIITKQNEKLEYEHDTIIRLLTVAGTIYVLMLGLFIKAVIEHK